VGTSALTALDVLYDKLKSMSWNFGMKFRKPAWSSTRVMLSHMKNLSFEWVLKDLNESGTSKWLFDSDKNSRDMRVVRGPKVIFPVN
jgi:hypothetical protein